MNDVAIAYPMWVSSAFERMIPQVFFLICFWHVVVLMRDDDTPWRQGKALLGVSFDNL